MPSETNNPRLWRYDLLFAAAAVLISLLYIAAAGGNFPLDDSWIHQTYARNLAQYHEWSFVPGQLSVASSSPLYTVILSAGYVLNIPFHIWTHGLGIVALAVTAMIGGRMALRLLPGNRLVAVLTGLALVGAWHLVWAAVSGMETPIFCMFTLLLSWLAWRELDPLSARLSSIALRGALFGLVSALTTLTRAEGIVLCGLLALSLLLTRPGRSWRGLIIYGTASLIVFAAILAPYLIFNYQITSGFLPNTAAAKAADATPLFYQSYFWRLGYLLEPLLAGGQIMLIPGMIAFAIWMVRDHKPIMLAVPLLWSVLLVLVYAAMLPLNIQHARYLIPSLPSALVCGVVGTLWMVHQARSSLIGRVLTRTLAVAAGLVFLLFLFILGLNAYKQDVAIVDQEMVASALWLRDHASPDELLIVHDIGAVGYFAPRPMLDIAGLISPEVIPLLFDADGMWALMQERGGRYLMALENQVPGENLSDPRLCPVFQSDGDAALRAGGSKMVIYALAWDGHCS